MICLITYLLSLLDLTATLYIVWRLGLETEGNRIGRYLLSEPIAAIIYKVVVVGCAVFLLWYFREKKVARIGVYVVCGVFVILTVYHMVCIGAMHNRLF